MYHQLSYKLWEVKLQKQNVPPIVLQEVKLQQQNYHQLSYRQTARDEIILDLDVTWAGESDIQVRLIC